jgi:hypothetical protein
MSRCSVSASNRFFASARLFTFSRNVAIMVAIGLIAVPLKAKADTIVVGVLSFDSLIPDGNNPDGSIAPGTNGFTIFNFTGANSFPGTPDSPLSFLDTSLLLNGVQTVNVGEVDPGSVQPLALQFSTTSTFTDAQFTATLNTVFFTIGGQNYVANSDQVTADLSPSSPPDLAAGTDFVVLDIDATQVNAAPVPEPASLWLVFGPAASLLWRRVRRCV